MELKSSVKNRRRDRIRQLQAGRPGESRTEPPIASQTHSVAEFSGYEPHDARYDRRWEDPEFVWKEREKKLLARASLLPSSEGSDHGDLPPGKRMTLRKTVLQALVCLFLFGGTWFLFRTDGDWAAKGQAAVRGALTEEFPFARVEAWYAAKFGDSASWIPAFGGKAENVEKVTARAGKTLTSPAQGTVTVPFSASSGGVLLRTKPDAPVYAMDEGRVLFAGSRQETGYTLVLAHANGLESSYGYLQPGKWQKSDWVQAGDLLGKTAPDETSAAAGKLFFALKKQSVPVNPMDVVRFD